MGTKPFVINVKQQLNTWSNLGVVISDELWEHILQQADAFEPVTDTDEPLVTGGFGYDDLCLDGVELRYASGFKPKGGLRLVHYDSNAYPNLSPKDARKAAKKDGLRLAGIEVLEHEFVFHSRLGGLGLAASYDGWSSPTVREC